MSTFIYQKPAELLQTLIRFDTTNPPGNERACIEFINGLLKDAGFDTTIVAKTPERPNIITRLKGDGKASPLLLYGHVDVVSTKNQKWTHPPFEGVIADGCVWGRGAIDNKHAISMYLCAILKAKAENLLIPGDVIFAATADEEVGGEYGAKFLVEEHPQLFEGVKYGLSEFGGFNISMVGKRIYPIQISEKQTCAMRMDFHGAGGHASMPVHGGAMAKLGRALLTLDKKPLPVHVTPPVRLMIEYIAKAIGGASEFVLRQLLNPVATELILKILGKQAVLFSPILHNTVSPTMLQASDKINVIPSKVSLGLDGRLLPGFTPEDMQVELHALLGKDFDIEVVDYSPTLYNLDMGLFDTLSNILKEADPQGIPIPFVGSWVTDARFFNQLGIQTYGFTPLRVPDDFDMSGLAHAADERVPIDALEFGVQAVYKAIQERN
ncbi:MAG: M20/M25/M40 family metallo-hydrolase [Anaerolineales bacterium]|nr:M20/M25/M40 family metallo-hydrolase [Anaerolineales bacterium]